MALGGMKEFNRNLERAKNLDLPEVRAGMAMWQTLVINHAKANHLWRWSLGPETASRHPHDRFYQVTGKAVNSMRPGRIFTTKTSISAEALAGGPATGYVAGLEFGTARSRAFPFMGPAIVGTAQDGLALLAYALQRTF